MVKLFVDNRLYFVEFRHITKFGKKAQLHSRAPISAVTTCSIILVDANGEPEFVAMDSAICSNEDNFWRMEGRLRSLKKVLRHCGALRGHRDNLWHEYQKVVGIPKNRRTSFNENALLVRYAKVTPILSEVEVEARKAKGAETRAQRQAAKAGKA